MKKWYINEKNKLGKISPEIYGHFSEHLGRCIYEGVYVGEDSPIPNRKGMRSDVVDALKELKIPVLRWPGGCFADEYHWRDGIGPKNERAKMINTHWGGVVEDNSFGTHEYFELCEQLGCKTYINGNLGSGTVREMSEWVEYMTFPGTSPLSELRKKNGRELPFQVDYFGVGNENWGCGGSMLPEYYANEYRRYQTYIRKHNQEHPIQKICCGPGGDDYQWTKKVLETLYAGGQGQVKPDGLSLHHYTIPGDWGHKGSATDFTEQEYYRTLQSAMHMEELIRRHGVIMDEFDPDKQIGMVVDEWGCWFDVEPGTNPGFLYQQNTMRDAMIAGLTLNIFNRHCDRVKMANIAQMVNVLQSVILTEGEKMLLTPTYHVFHMMRQHQGGELIESNIADNSSIKEDESEIKVLNESASIQADGTLNLTILNLSVREDEIVEIILPDRKCDKVISKIMTGKINDYNSFEQPDIVHEETYSGYSSTEHGILMTIPACSIIQIRIN